MKFVAAFDPGAHLHEVQFVFGVEPGFQVVAIRGVHKEVAFVCLFLPVAVADRILRLEAADLFVLKIDLHIVGCHPIQLWLQFLLRKIQPAGFHQLRPDQFPVKAA